MRLAAGWGEKYRSSSWWPERLAAFCALAGVVLASLPGFHVRTFQDAGSDFKTLYASATCFLRGQLAYNFHSIGEVFNANGVVQPANWYAHAPIYLPFTFAVLAPMTALPMVIAVYLWMALSTVALLFAVWSLADLAQRSFGLGRIWRLVLLALIAASPSVSFVLQIGNVSVVAAALSIIAVAGGERVSPTWRVVALTVSMLLKPHIAFWLLLAMLLSHRRDDRSLAVRTSVVVAVSLIVICGCFAILMPAGLQLHDYTAMVSSEIATGSMNPRNHELLPPAAEITSLQSLFGYFMEAPAMRWISGVLLVLFGGSLLYLSRALRREDMGTRLELLGAWSTFGMLVTYHRTHDGIILFLLLPWALARIVQRAADIIPWGALALGTLITFGSFPPTFDWVATLLHLPWFSQFLVFRQSALATALLMILLILDLVRQSVASRASFDQESSAVREPMMRVASISR